MLDADEREGSSRGRLDLLLEQLGANVVSETLEVELEALGGFQSGAAPLEGGPQINIDILKPCVPQGYGHRSIGSSKDG